MSDYDYVSAQVQHRVAWTPHEWIAYKNGLAMTKLKVLLLGLAIIGVSLLMLNFIL